MACFLHSICVNYNDYITEVTVLHKIPYTYTNKSKQVFYLMIVALLILRLILMGEIYFFDLKGYDVYLLPTVLYYLVLFIIVTGIFFGYKFFFTLYDEEKIVYCNLLLKKSSSIDFSEIAFARFGRRGIALYRSPSPGEKNKPDLFIPFFRFGIIQAIPVNAFFETLIEKRKTQDLQIEKEFKVLPGYTRIWNLVSLVYAFLSFCLLIVAMEPLYTVIVLFQNFA